MKPRGPAAYRLLARGYATATGAVLAMQRDAPKHLREIISEAQEAGFAAVELELRILALALGNMDGLGRLAKITEEFEGPQAQAAGRLARAFLDEDIDELLRFGAGKVEPDGAA